MKGKLLNIGMIVITAAAIFFAVTREKEISDLKKENSELNQYFDNYRQLSNTQRELLFLIDRSNPDTAQITKVKNELEEISKTVYVSNRKILADIMKDIKAESEASKKN